MRREHVLKPGTRLGSCTITELLGEGGTARVYLTTHDDGRVLALKVIQADDAATTRRFLREFESLRLLRVPGVVRVHEAGFDGDRVWFSMDRVFGRPFHEAFLEEPYLPDRVERVVAAAAGLMATLAELHASGFAHRDLKPSNVLVDAGGAPQVLDFGVSRWFADEATSTDIVLGTVPYMAPEQVAALPVGPQADVFAAGLMIHESLAGLPERPAHALGWVARTCLERRTPLAVRFREVPLSLSRLVERMTAVDPADRPTAAACAETLQAIARGDRGREWPTPPFADPGAWWSPVEGLLSADPRICVLDGSRGSGRTRIAEQVMRAGLLQGVWTLRLRCAAERVGAPFHDLLATLCESLRDESLAKIAGSDFELIATLWPHLPLPRREVEGLRAARALPEALAGMVRRFEALKKCVLVIERVEEIDPLTAATLYALSRQGPPILLVHEHRWATNASRRLIRELKRRGALVLPVEPHGDAAAIAASLCPAAPPQVPKGCSAQQAVEIGWAALAAWRGEKAPALDPDVIVLASHDRPIPVAVLRRVAGHGADGSPCVERSEAGVTLAGDSLRDMAEVRLGDRTRTARRVREAWEQALEHLADPRDLARLSMVAQEPVDARRHAIRAALAADRAGLYPEARTWLLLTEALASDAPDDAVSAFELAWTKARVSLHTDPGEARRTLLEAAENATTSARQETRVRLLEAMFALREGANRRALATALLVGAQGSVDPDTASRALLVAVQVRMALGDTLAARRELHRASELASASTDPRLALDVAGWEAELAWHARELHRSEQLSREALTSARALGSAPHEAAILARLSAIQRLFGDRIAAEQSARAARELYRRSGDVLLDVRSGLALATLEAERGELVQARARLDAVLRTVTALGLDDQLPVAMRLALRIAAARGDVADAGLALAVLERDPSADDEAPAAMVRWWRARGDLDRALSVAAPTEPGFGRGLWHVERARARVAQADLTGGREEATMALVIAGIGGFVDLLVYARLVVEGLDPACAEPRISALVARASSSPWIDLALAAMEFKARRERDPDRAGGTWRTLAARARELGYRSEADDADAWQGPGP